MIKNFIALFRRASGRNAIGFGLLLAASTVSASTIIGDQITFELTIPDPTATCSVPPCTLTDVRTIGHPGIEIVGTGASINTTIDDFFFVGESIDLGWASLDLIELTFSGPFSEGTTLRMSGFGAGAGLPLDPFLTRFDTFFGPPPFAPMAIVDFGPDFFELDLKQINLGASVGTPISWYIHVVLAEPVPVPPAFWLLGSAMGVLCLVRRKATGFHCQ